jgi:ankyrin repeat protein
VSAGHEDVVRELVGAGADVNRKNDKGITPLLVYNVPVGDHLYQSHKYYSDTMQHQNLALTYVSVGVMNVHILMASTSIDRKVSDRKGSGRM